MGAAKRRKAKPPLVERVARGILPPEQVRRRDYTLADVANHTDAEQRHMVRSGEKKTIKRKTHIAILYARKALTARQAAICEWYAEQHEVGFEVGLGVCANYCGAGGGGFGADDLLARHKAQAEARHNYATARSALRPAERIVFERVVLDKVPLAKAAIFSNRRITVTNTNAFRRAIAELEDTIGHLVKEA
jgi:hypothetical protein